MPYIDLQSADDYASIWYTTNSPFGNVGGFDPEKPTIIILHPTFLDSTWLHNQFGDPRLDSAFNLIAFDMRVCGRSTCRPSGRHDSWVEAADLAFAVQALQLAPSHLLALEGLSTNNALRFATLFPEMCLSLTFCNVPAPTELKWVFTAYDELLQSWCYANDLESFEHVGMEAVTFVVGPDCHPDLQDDLIAYWETEMPPSRRQRIVEQVNVIMNRTPLNADVYACISQPVLIIHGERNETCPRKYAEKLASDLINAEGGAVLYTVKGASGCLNIVPGNASIANQVLAKFLSRLPHARSDIVPRKMSTNDRMEIALARLAEIAGDSSIASRDPLSSLSFSCLAPEVVKSQSDSLVSYGKGHRQAFLPLGPDGRPIRKFSDRKQTHWFHGEKDGLSYAGSIFNPSTRNKQNEAHEKQLPMPTSEPISTETAQDSRLRRSTFNSSSVEKLVIKGSMAKVVGGPPISPFQRLLL